MNQTKSSTSQVGAAPVCLELTPKETTRLPNAFNSTSHHSQEQSEYDSPPKHSGLISRIKGSISKRWQLHRAQLRCLALVAAASLYLAYFTYAMYFRFGDDGSIQLVAMTTVAVVGTLITVAKKRWGMKLKKRVNILNKKINRYGSVINWYSDVKWYFVIHSN